MKRTTKSKTKTQRAAVPETKGLTVRAIAESLGLSVEQVQGAIKKVVPLQCITLTRKQNRKLFLLNEEAVELIKGYYAKPEGWLTADELAKALKYSGQDSVVRNMRTIPGWEKYRKKRLRSYYYDPALIPLLETKKRPLVHVVNPPPEGVEWFKPREFIHIFARVEDTLEDWIKAGKIPADLIKRNERGHRFISREAIACIDGVLIDYSVRKAQPKEPLPPESDELIEMDGYCLTKEEHARRLECKKRGLSAGLIDHQRTSC